MAAAAVICVTLAFTSVSKKAYNRGLYAHIQEMPVNMTEYSTSNGEIRRVTLPDSSKVILNAGSVLICPERFGAGGREVYLSGEAVFDVTGDTGRAFVVKTSNLNVKVHGTRFNVSAYSDSRLVSATLCRGSISAMSLIFDRNSYKSRVMFALLTRSYACGDYKVVEMGGLRL